MAEHKECKHYEGCGYRNDIGRCPNWCGQFKHKDDVRVVRCKDCKHYVLQSLACRHENFNGIIQMDGFCSYGERKGNA